MQKFKDFWSKNKVNVIGWSVIVLVIIGLVYASYTGQQQHQQVLQQELAVTATDNIRANKDATVTFIEYADFQCPACASYYPLLKEVVSQRADKIKYVFRHYPLTSIHQNAVGASLAAEAAGLQGKFWEMHDKLFEVQNEWSNEADPTVKFTEYAKALKLDAKKFAAALEDESLLEKIREQAASGNRIGVNATPTFYVNGTQITNPDSVSDFINAIDAALPK